MVSIWVLYFTHHTTCVDVTLLCFSIIYFYFTVEAGSPELSLLPHTYYNNGSVLVKVKVIGGTPIENEVNWMLDLSFMTLTLQPGQLGGSYTALNTQVR